MRPVRALVPGSGAEVETEALYSYPPDRPWLRANMVCSLDGAVAVEGRSGGLSSPADKQLFALQRGLCDVIVVGAGTAKAEGYQSVTAAEARTSWRVARGLAPVPPIAVVTNRLSLDPSSLLFRGAIARTIVVTSAEGAARHGHRFAEVADVVVRGNAQVDIAAAIDHLVERGHRRLLCEGGPALLASVVAADRLDELALTLAPKLVAGKAARVLDGPALAPVRTMSLASLCEEDGFLFGRWCRPPIRR